MTAWLINSLVLISLYFFFHLNTTSFLEVLDLALAKIKSINTEGLTLYIYTCCMCVGVDKSEIQCFKDSDPAGV